MISDSNKKQKREVFRRVFYFVGAAILFLVASAILIYADVKIYKEKQKLNAQLDGYKKQIQEIQDRNKSLKEGIVQADDSNYVEKIAREELDLQKPGEKVVTFVMPPQQPKEENKQQNAFDFKNLTGWLSQAWKNIFK